MELLNQYINVFSMNEWLMSSVVVVLVISLYSMNRQRNIQKQQQVSMQALQRDLRALANAAVGVGSRVLEIERTQRKNPTAVTANSKQQPAAKPTYSASPVKAVEYYNPNSQPYEQAIGMAQSGASTDDIVNLCGLSKSEADLVSMMHRLDKAS